MKCVLGTTATTQMQMNDPGAKREKAGSCTVLRNQVSRAIIAESPRLANGAKGGKSIECETRTRLPTEDFESCSRLTPSVTMGHIPRKCGSILGGLPAIVTHVNRYSPIEQAKFRPSLG